MPRKNQIVTRIEKRHFKGTVYNIGVEEDDSYALAEGIFVHNCKTPVNETARFSVVNHGLADCPKCQVNNVDMGWAAMQAR